MSEKCDAVGSLSKLIKKYGFWNLEQVVSAFGALLTNIFRKLRWLKCDGRWKKEITVSS